MPPSQSRLSLMSAFLTFWCARGYTQIELRIHTPYSVYAALPPRSSTALLAGIRILKLWHYGMISNQRISVALATLLLMAAGPATDALTAQDRTVVEVQGRVVDARTADSIPGATVLIMDSYGDRIARRITDEAGRFSVEVHRRSAIRLRVGGLGYETVNTPLLHFGDNDFFVLEILLDVDAVPIAPLEVVAQAETLERSVAFRGFDHRVQLGFGSYFTRSDIDEIQPQRVSDLLRRVPGVRLTGSGAGHRQIVTMSRSLMGRGGGPCQVQIYMDGRLITRARSVDISVDELVAPGDLEGVEIYRGLSTVPAEFMTPDAHCGVVALWTRRGGDN